MEVTLKGLSKRFGGHWLFKDLNLQFTAPGCWAIVGPNGSGKTTLLQIIAGLLLPSQGTVEHKIHQQNIQAENWYRHLWLAAPYMELLEELTLKEMLTFHFQLKPPGSSYSAEELAQACHLEGSFHKPISKFSSGMKQRLKLALGVYSDLPLLLLDEPTTNLDRQGFEWYHRQITRLLDKKLIIICSNQPAEYDFCQQIVDLGNVQ